MLNLTKHEIKLKMIFLHFLYMCKVNKERKYVPRNGKMPDVNNKEDAKTGYKTYCLITLRSFLNGLFPKTHFTLTKAKYNDEYTISAKGRLEYGLSTIADQLLWLSVMREWSPGVANLDQWTHLNHTITFEHSDLHTRYGHLPFSMRYRVNFADKVQSFVPVAWDQYEQMIDRSVQEFNVVEEKAGYSVLTHRLLNKLRDNQMLKREVSTARRTDVVIDEVSSLAMKYRIPKTILENFISNYRNVLSGSRGLSPGQIFEYTKNINRDLHERVNNLEYHDFEDLAA